MKGIKELTERLAAKGKIISQIYDEAGEDLDFSKVKCLEGDTTAKIEALKAIDKEVTDLRAERATLLDIEKALKAGRELNEEMNTPAQEMKHPVKGAEGKAEYKSLGEMFVESKVHTDMKGREVFFDVDLKTVMSAGAGWDPPTMREARVEAYPVAPISVIDVIPSKTTQRDTIKYMKETTYTATNAVEIKESIQGTMASYGEVALAWTETSDEVEKIACFIPVTDEQLEDVPGLSALINERLGYMLRARLDGQILVGDGVAPNLLGTLSLDSLQEQAKGNDPTPDAIYKGMTLVRTVGFAEPSVLFINPTDWQAIRLLTTADGIYLFGSPMEAGPSRIWGVPVVQTTRMTENTALVGDYARYSNLYVKRGVTVKVTDSHASNFTQGVQNIRADMRCAMVHYRITAFSSVTGI